MTGVQIPLEKVRQGGLARAGVATAGNIEGAIVFVRPLSKSFGFDMWEWYVDLGTELEQEWAALDLQEKSVQSELDGFQIRWYPLAETNRVVAAHFPELSPDPKPEK